MSFDAHKNLVVTKVATAPSPATSGTSLVVDSGDGAHLPTAPFNMTISPDPTGLAPDAIADASEIVRVTLIATDTLTIVRAQEGTTARTVVVGDIIAVTMTAKTITDIEAVAKGVFSSYAYIRDEKAAGTDGGTFTQGSWQTRVLNTEQADASGIVSIASNQFTLQAGTYFIRARAPALGCNFHQCKIRNITDSADTLIGTGMFADSTNNGCNVSEVQGRFTIAGAKAFELQHQCSATKATNGFGSKGNFGVTEVFGEVEIWKE